MSIDTFDLPGFIIAGLYKQTLVDIPEAEKQQVALPAGYKFLGRNQKKITLLVNSPGHVFLSDEEFAFIGKILGACKLSSADVAIVNQATTPVLISEIKKQLEPVILFLFGIDPTEIRLPVQFPRFKTQVYDGCTYLYIPPLAELDKDTEEGKLLKSKMWVCLRKLFEV